MTLRLGEIMIFVIFLFKNGSLPQNQDLSRFSQGFLTFYQFRLIEFLDFWRFQLSENSLLYEKNKK